MCVVSSGEDPLFGPVIGFSVAGMPTELLGDISYLIPPLTDVDVSGGEPKTVLVTLCTVESGRVAVATTVNFDRASSDSGALQVTVADPTPGTTPVTSGAAGRSGTSTDAEGAEEGP
jgi:hypothetical protein